MDQELRERMEAEIEVLLYGIVDKYNNKVKKLGKAQAQYAILGEGAYLIVNLVEKILKDKEGDYGNKKSK